MFRTILAVSVVVASLVFASAAMSVPTKITLNGTVGPGFTISLKKGTKKVKILKKGTYVFKINDKSSSHNFALKGPKVNKQLTGVGFVGKKTVTIKLKKGKYEYFCVPHKSQMHGFVTVK
jgi:plastocyanin